MFEQIRQALLGPIFQNIAKTASVIIKNRGTQQLTQQAARTIRSPEFRKAISAPIAGAREGVKTGRELVQNIQQGFDSPENKRVRESLEKRRGEAVNQAFMQALEQHPQLLQYPESTRNKYLSHAVEYPTRYQFDRENRSAVQQSREPAVKITDFLLGQPVRRDLQERFRYEKIPEETEEKEPLVWQQIMKLLARQ